MFKKPKNTLIKEAVIDKKKIEIVQKTAHKNWT